MADKTNAEKIEQIEQDITTLIIERMRLGYSNREQERWEAIDKQIDERRAEQKKLA